MSRWGWVELILGIVSGVVGLITVGYVFFTPSNCPADAANFAGCESIAQHQGIGAVWPMLAIALVLFPGIVGRPITHVWRGSPGGLALPLLLTVILAASTRLGSFVTFFLTPSALLALAAVALGLARTLFLPMAALRH